MEIDWGGGGGGMLVNMCSTWLGMELRLLFHAICLKECNASNKMNDVQLYTYIALASFPGPGAGTH